MLVKMSVKNLAVDPLFNAPIVILKNDDGDLVVPIWIGAFEANAILNELENSPTTRPMTHDLIKTILSKVELTLERILITDIRDGVYFAVIDIKSKSGTISIDARPSDAIALALRFDAPIFVSQDVIEKCNAAEHGSDPDDVEKLRDWLKSLKPEDFGKYKM